jgi:hypothetical protein
MTYSEIIRNIKRLSLSEQRAIYNELQRTLKGASGKHAARPRHASNYQAGAFQPAKDSSLFRVLGALREPGKPAPTDEEVEQMVADYLLEKHA